nr:hypothetical protein [Tanacetum cinerariifolium]
MWQLPIGQPPVTWQLRQHRSTPSVNDGQSRRPTTVNAASHRATTADHGGDRRSMVAVNDGRRWRTTVDCRWTTVDHHQTAGNGGCREFDHRVDGGTYCSEASHFDPFYYHGVR